LLSLSVISIRFNCQAGAELNGWCGALRARRSSSPRTRKASVGKGRLARLERCATHALLLVLEVAMEAVHHTVGIDCRSLVVR
jgi:hypothetical protein